MGKNINQIGTLKIIIFSSRIEISYFDKQLFEKLRDPSVDNNLPLIPA